MLRILVQQGSTVVLDQHYDDQTVYIGRSDDCQVRLIDQVVGDHHIMLFPESKSWCIESLREEPRIHVNESPLHGKQIVKHLDEISLGPYQIRLFLELGSGGEGIPGQIVPKARSQVLTTEVKPEHLAQLPPNSVVKQHSDAFSLSQGRLDYLAEFSVKLLETNKIQTVMQQTLDLVVRYFESQVAWIGLRTDSDGNLHFSEGRTISGGSTDAPSQASDMSFAVVEAGRHVLVPDFGEQPHRSALAVPLTSPDGVLGMIYCESVPNKSRYTVSDLDFLSYLGTQVAVVLDRLLREETRQIEEVRDAGLDLARRIQSRVVPWQLPQWPGYQMAVFSESGTKRCSDFYDVAVLADKKAAILVGSVLARGTQTAVTMGEICAAFRIGAVHRDTPAVLMRELNWLIGLRGQAEDRLAGCVTGVLDPETGTFELAGAGPICAVLIDEDGGSEEVCPNPGPVIGREKKVKYESVSSTLQPGQVLAIFTPGMEQATDKMGRQWGRQRLVRSLADAFGQAAARMLSDLADDLMQFAGRKRQDEDMSLLLIRREMV